MDVNKAAEPVTQYDQDKVISIMERQVKRLFILCIVIFAALIATNLGWIIYESQFEDTLTITQDVDSGASPAYVNGTGEMTVNGESKANNH